MSINYEDIRKKVEKITAGAAVPENLKELLESGVITLIASSFYVENMQKLPKNVMNHISSTAPTGHGMRITFGRKQRGTGAVADAEKGAGRRIKQKHLKRRP